MCPLTCSPVSNMRTRHHSDQPRHFRNAWRRFVCNYGVLDTTARCKRLRKGRRISETSSGCIVMWHYRWTMYCWTMYR
ncbi:hypothetical protein XELAEV_18044505mg [Xenopus laevis]|uniref:Uncharacterized protein n=1 Tax=Xenopus laevis TaxID=8355 RepID=A0A974H3B3_XENLA|nr:hypothetical protein XELAEV_18044505mg [Xenopus laevis]